MENEPMTPQPTTPSAGDVERACRAWCVATGRDPDEKQLFDRSFGGHWVENWREFADAMPAFLAALTPTTDTAGLLRAAEIAKEVGERSREQRAHNDLYKMRTGSRDNTANDLCDAHISVAAEIERRIRALATTPPARSDGPSNQHEWGSTMVWGLLGVGGRLGLTLGSHVAIQEDVQRLRRQRANILRTLEQLLLLDSRSALHGSFSQWIAPLVSSIKGFCKDDPEPSPDGERGDRDEAGSAPVTPGPTFKRCHPACICETECEAVEITDSELEDAPPDQPQAAPDAAPVSPDANHIPDVGKMVTALEVLRKIEFIDAEHQGPNGDRRFDKCPRCETPRWRGHNSHCDLAAALEAQEELNILHGQLAEVEKKAKWLQQRSLESSMLAQRWMECHDCLKAGKPYDFPKPADLPDSLAKLAEALVELETSQHECAYWEAQHHVLEGKLAERDKTIAELTREHETAKTVISWANNSLYGSHGYFLGVDGGYDEHHLDRPIEGLKKDCRNLYAAHKTIAELRAGLEFYGHSWQDHRDIQVGDSVPNRDLSTDQGRRARSLYQATAKDQPSNQEKQNGSD